jgi:putative hydrolase of the HAD superfamily
VTSVPTLQAVFWDIDDTMFSTTAFVKLARERAIQAMLDRGLALPLDRVLDELQAVVDEFGPNDDRHYDRLLQRLPKTVIKGVNRHLLVTAGVIAYHETKWKELKLRASSKQLLQDMANAGLKLGVITAGLARKQMEKILRLGLDRYVDPKLIFITDQVGIAKSNPKLYRQAARTAGVKPGQAMHVGDHPHSDIQSAQQAGMITVWYRGSGKYAALKPARQPNHEISKVSELRQILTQIYGVL